MDEIDWTLALAQILQVAHEQQFTYPLHLAITAADGKRIAIVCPAMGADPDFVEGAELSGNMRPPYRVVLQECDAPAGSVKQRTIHARVTVTEEGKLAVAVATRTSRDLIRELEEEGARHWYAAIAVGFDNSSVFVKSTDIDRQRLLDNALRNGGIPLGVIALDRADEAVTVMSWMYPEYAHVEKYRDTLGRLTDLVIQGIGEGKPPETPGGWRN